MWNVQYVQYVDFKFKAIVNLRKRGSCYFKIETDKRLAKIKAIYK